MVNPLLYETIQVESANLCFIKLVKVPLMLVHYVKYCMWCILESLGFT